MSLEKKILNRQIYTFLADKLAPCKMAVGENDIHTFERNI
jgi:hypothetical protein